MRKPDDKSLRNDAFSEVSEASGDKNNENLHLQHL